MNHFLCAGPDPRPDRTFCGDPAMYLINGTAYCYTHAAETADRSDDEVML